MFQSPSFRASGTFSPDPSSTAAANLIAILTGSSAVGAGAIWVVKKLRGRSPGAVRRKDGRRVEIEIDGETIEVDEVVARVSVDVSVRAALERVVAEPLASEGIDAVAIGLTDHMERIEKPDGFAFRPPIDRESGAYEYRYRAPFSIVSLSFKQGNKWRLNDGRTTLNVTVVDHEFLGRVDQSEIAFSKGDILICDVRVETRERPGDSMRSSSSSVSSNIENRCNSLHCSGRIRAECREAGAGNTSCDAPTAAGSRRK